MANKRKNKNDAAAQRREQEDAAFYRVVGILVIAIVTEIIGIVYYRNMGSRMFKIGAAGSMNVGRWVFMALAVLFIGAAVFQALRKRNNKLYVWGAVFALILFAAAELIYYGHGGGALTVCVATPVLAALAFVYIIFQREFFIDSTLCTLAIVTLAGVRGTVIGLPVYAVVSIVLSLAAIIVVLIASRNEGIFAGRRVIERIGSGHISVILAAALSIVTVIPALLLGAGFAYWAIFVVGAFLFIDAVYHTVKLM